VIRSHASSVPRAALPAAASVAALVTALVAALLWATGPARADTAPVPPEPVPTVAADVLPTVQINGVVWSQIVVGNRVYATGRFTRARPAGAAAGTSETVRNNILAYDLTTGALITSWAPSLNAQGFTLAASPDGTRIYVGGEFTNVSGVSKLRIAALDATTGAVITSFNARTNTRVRAIATSGSTVYLGGNFSDINGSARSKVGAVAASNGAVTTWNPGANAEVFGLVALSGKVVAGGRFTTFGGRAAYGMGAVNSSTGAGLAWPINSVVRNAGPDAAIYSLSSNGTNVFGTGYVFGGGGNFEGTFNADSNGNIVWVTDCRGDTYSSFPIGGVLYSVGHAHDCRSIGGNPETNPRSYQYALAQTVARGPNNAINVSGRFVNRPAPMPLHWLPTLTAGSFTGTNQGPWSIAGNANYVVMGGEFPRVNGTAQQGLVRFALRAIAPNRQGPQGGTQLKPTLANAGARTLRISWQAAWDRDNKRLTYQVLRGPTASGATVVATRTADTQWWNRPTMSVTDSTAPPGSSQTYRIRATDPLGNVVTSDPTTATVPAAAVAQAGTVTENDADAGTTAPATGDADTVKVPAGESKTVRLDGVPSTGTDVTTGFSLEGTPTGGGAYLSTTVRGTAAGDYRVKVRVASTGVVTSQLVKSVGGKETALSDAAVVPGVTYAAGTRLQVRVQATGASPTTLRARVWAQGITEPTSWLNTATDATAGLQAAGSVGYTAYTSSAATEPAVFRVDAPVAKKL
jgi:hypothetical protein